MTAAAAAAAASMASSRSVLSVNVVDERDNTKEADKRHADVKIERDRELSIRVLRPPDILDQKPGYRRRSVRLINDGAGRSPKSPAGQWTN